MANLLFKSLTIGITRRWWDGLRNGLAAVGAIWALTEMTTAALPLAKLYLEAHGDDYLTLMVVLFVGVFIAFVLEPIRVTFKVPTTDTKITLKYGDLFAEDANLLIGVNEFFDGELGLPVSVTSLHGQLIARNYGSNAVAFRSAIDPALATTGVQPAAARVALPTYAYPIGTTAQVPNGARSVFLMAMARTDPVNYKASSDPATLWQALQGGLEVVHARGGGAPLAMPLFGNGQAGINLTPQHLLRLLTLALVDFGRNSNTQLPKQVTVVLHDRCFEELDIREIARDWKKI
jgi:hypothetical protein